MPKFSDLFVALGLQDDKFKKGMQQNKSRVNSFSKSIKTMGATLVAALSVRAIFQFGKAALEAYDVQVKAEAKLLQSLGGRKAIQKDLINQAQDLQKETLYGDEATIEAQSRLAMMGLESDAIKGLIPLIQDLAAAKGMDLVQAADMVAKSVGSSTNAMSRYGIEITGTVGSSERLETAMKALNEQVGGQAKIAAETGLGPLVQLSNTWGDFSETLGGMVAPALNNVFTGLTNIMNTMSELNSSESVSFWDKVLLTINPSDIDHVAKVALKMSAERIKNKNILDEQVKTEQELDRIQKEQLKNSGALNAEQQKEADKQLLINKQVSDRLAKESSLLQLIKDQADARKTAAEDQKRIDDEAKGASLVVFDSDEEIEDPFPYLDPEVLDAKKNALDALGESMQTVGEVAGDFAASLVSGLDLAESGFEGFLAGMANTVIKLISILLSQTLATAISGAATSGAATGPLAVFSTPVFIATAVAGVLSAFAAIPKFAEGGLVSAPLMGMIGEGIGTSRSNPEVVAPLDKLMGMMGGGGSERLVATVTGEQIQFVLDRNNKRRSQSR